MSDPQGELRRWINESLRHRGHGSGIVLAKRIGIEPEMLSRMKNTDGTKEMRSISAHLIPPMAEFFDSIPPDFEPLADLRCKNCRYPAMLQEGRGEPEHGGVAMAEKTKEITIKIETPQQGTLIVGDNNTITTHNSQSVAAGTTLSPEQAVKLDIAVKEVAAACKAEPAEIWKDLCAALEVTDSALIAREAFPAAEKILHRWKGGAIREAVNEKG